MWECRLPVCFRTWTRSSCRPLRNRGCGRRTSRTRGQKRSLRLLSTVPRPGCRGRRRSSTLGCRPGSGGLEFTNGWIDLFHEKKEKLFIILSLDSRSSQQSSVAEDPPQFSSPSCNARQLSSTHLNDREALNYVFFSRTPIFPQWKRKNIIFFSPRPHGALPLSRVAVPVPVRAGPLLGAAIVVARGAPQGQAGPPVGGEVGAEAGQLRADRPAGGAVALGPPAGLAPGQGDGGGEAGGVRHRKEEEKQKEGGGGRRHLC